MKTKELLLATELDDITIFDKLQILSHVVIKEVVNYYDGICSALVEVNNKDYLATWLNFECEDYYVARRYVVLDTCDYNYNSFEELMNRDIEVIGYYYECSKL